MLRIRITLILACLTSVWSVAVRETVAQENDEPKFIIVVNAENPTSSLTRKEASRLFTKKKGRWDDWIAESGEEMAVIPVDRERSAEVRIAFSRAIHQKSANSMETYWQHLIFSGRGAPPGRLSSDEEVLRFVRAQPGAVGYVASGAELGEGVKELKIISE